MIQRSLQPKKQQHHRHHRTHSNLPRLRLSNLSQLRLSNLSLLRLSNLLLLRLSSLPQLRLSNLPQLRLSNLPLLRPSNLLQLRLSRSVSTLQRQPLSAMRAFRQLMSLSPRRSWIMRMAVPFMKLNFSIIMWNMNMRLMP